ncbi:uncharacterized protein LOC135961175, partial [Calliphora vicina]|uniref:uncharacterized protein LOC135961175 n=1 Tax=Calliphora vicina TaxID=7373 RepID=UPI00325B745C
IYRIVFLWISKLKEYILTMALFTTFNLFELFIAFSVMPLVFVFLWCLIVGDFKNFQGSQKAYSVFTAKDPINCYQNYVEPKKSK